jgi:hypothetical protein
MIFGFVDSCQFSKGVGILLAKKRSGHSGETNRVHRHDRRPAAYALVLKFTISVANLAEMSCASLICRHLPK